jgi:hypothetical protein
MKNDNENSLKQSEEIEIKDEELVSMASAFCVRTGMRAGSPRNIIPCI